MFSWIPIHRETIHRLLEHRNNQTELVAILREMQQRGLKVISLEDEDVNGQTIPLAEIDPFTFLASFNRGVTDQARRDNWGFLKEKWGLSEAVPDDFAGIPTLHNMVSRLFPRGKRRQQDHVAQLWQIAAAAEHGTIEVLDEAAFNRVVKLRCVGIGNLTIGLFWINPEKFLATDWKTRSYGTAGGITVEPVDYRSYRQWREEMTRQYGANYAQVSHDAHLLATRTSPTLELTPDRMRTLWAHFHRSKTGFVDFRNPGADFVIGETGYKRAALRRFREDLGRERLSTLIAQRQGTKAVKEIGRILTTHLVDFRAWDKTFGRSEEAACDVLEACLDATSTPYTGPDNTRCIFEACSRHRLKPAWDPISVFLWALSPDDFFPVKISYYRDLAEELGYVLPDTPLNAEKLHTMLEFGRAFWRALEPQAPVDWVDVQSFIWCVCPKNRVKGPLVSAETINDGDENPRVGEAERQYWTLSPGTGGELWSEFQAHEIAAIGWDATGDLRQYKSKQELRRKLSPGGTSKTNDAHACWQFLYDVEKGDIIFAKQGMSRLLGYGVVEGEYEFDAKRARYQHVRRVKWLAQGDWELPEGGKLPLKTLTDMTPFPESVRLMASKVGLALPPLLPPDPIQPVPPDPEPYDQRIAMQGLFLPESEFNEMLTALKEKKNLVLQGAPGVGKTYVARRLAYALIGAKDLRRVEVIQFHQSYSYEDFIQGFRPTPTGCFELKHGIFHHFCRRAQSDEGRPYVFIIDEINRGNLSKIFGELMMLIEPDKRGKEHAIPLTYSQDPHERFYIPENLHFIGTMNTADRSLAMVDYALRRRFRFIRLKPGFSDAAFRRCLEAAGAAPGLIEKIISRMGALNQAVTEDAKNLGEGYMIGHSYFCPSNGMTLDEDWYRRVVKCEIVPLIEEYWFDNDKKVEELRSRLLA